MSGDQPNRPPLPWLHFRKRLDRLKRQLPPVEECEKVLEQPEIVIIDDDDDDPVIIYESIAPKIQVIKASEKEVKKFINSYEESIRGIDKQTMIMQKYNDDFDFCMRHTTQENMKQLKGKRGAFITMVDQIAEAQTSLLEDSSSIIEDSRKITDTLREKTVREQEFYKRISVCVPNNIHNVTKSSKPEIPENFQLIFQRYKGMEEKRSLFITTKEARKPPSLDDFRKLLTKPELVEVKFEKWTPELEEGIAQSDLKTRFTHLNYEETFRHNKWTSISAEHALKSPEELRRRLDDQERVLEEEEREEKKLEDSITAIMDQFQKVQLQYVVVKQQLEEQLKVQSELDEIEKAVKSVQDLIRKQFNTVQKECPVCYLEFTNAVNSERCPLVWQCGHTSCNTCSRTLVNIAKPNKPLCPVCRKKHMLSNFIPNFGLMPKPT